MTLTIGMRLHALIMAAAEGSRCWGLSYDPKVRVLLESVGAPGWTLCDESIEGIEVNTKVGATPQSSLASLPTNPEAIAAAWLAAYEQPNPIAPAQVAQLRDRAQLHGLMLARVLRD
jgi:polysaccharide pyruvyl transferase WcaK-like protein